MGDLNSESTPVADLRFAAEEKGDEKKEAEKEANKEAKKEEHKDEKKDEKGANEEEAKLDKVKKAKILADVHALEAKAAGKELADFAAAKEAEAAEEEEKEEKKEEKKDEKKEEKKE